MRQPNERLIWKRVLRAWNAPACKFEAASRYVQLFPHRACGWIALADGLAQTARYREAQAALRKAGSLISPHDRYHVAIQWGHLYGEKRDEKRSERWYRKALDLHPCASTHIFLGGSLAKQGRFTEAKKHHRRAIQIAKGPAKDLADEAYFNLGLILRAERRYREAVLMFKKAIRLSPRYEVARKALNDVERALRLQRADWAG